MEVQKYGGMEVLSFGSIELKEGYLEVWNYLRKEVQRFGSMQGWKYGSMEVWKY